MRVGLSAAAFYGRMETEDQAAFIAEHLDIDVCEIFLETHSEYTAEFGRLVRRNLNGLPCVSVHPKGTQFEPDLFGRSRRQTEDAMVDLRGVLAAGEAVGARYYVMHGPSGVHRPVDVRRIHEFQQRFLLIQELAARHGMEILLENVHWAAINSITQLRAARELLPQAHFVLDVKQADMGGESPFDVLEAMGDRVRHVHLLDWQSDGTLCLPGEGCFDFPRLIRQLRAQHYPEDACLIIEPYEHLSRDMDRLTRSIAYLRELAENP